MMNLLVCQVVFVSFPVFWLLTHPQDLSLITKRSFVFGLAASLVSLFYAICLFGAFKLKPENNSEIMITVSFSVVLLAIINHFLGYRMQPHQWFGTVVALIGIALVSWKR
jgi:drug/metabolite transporter (DMT)-like permease